MSLPEQITKLCPWVNDGDAKRIADECLALPGASEAGRLSEKAYRYAKHVFAEAGKLKPHG